MCYCSSCRATAGSVSHCNTVPSSWVPMGEFVRPHYQIAQYFQRTIHRFHLMNMIHTITNYFFLFSLVSERFHNEIPCDLLSANVQDSMVHVTLCRSSSWPFITAHVFLHHIPSNSTLCHFYCMCFNKWLLILYGKSRKGWMDGDKSRSSKCSVISVLPSLHTLPYPQYTLRKEEVNFLNPIKKRNKDGIVYKQI